MPSKTPARRQASTTKSKRSKRARKKARRRRRTRRPPKGAMVGYVLFRRSACEEIQGAMSLHLERDGTWRLCTGALEATVFATQTAADEAKKRATDAWLKEFNKSHNREARPDEIQVIALHRCPRARARCRAQRERSTRN